MFHLEGGFGNVRTEVRKLSATVDLAEEQPAMGRFRFKVRTIIGWVVVCGIALAALTDSSDLWNEGIFSFTVLILLLSALEALHTRRRAERSGSVSCSSARCNWGSH